MTNREKHGFSNQPLIDSHMHIEKATTVERAFEIYNLICDYYNYERFCINGLTGINNDFIDFGSNIKALYVKSRMNAENPKKCYVFGHIHHHLDGKDTAEGFYRQAKQLYEMGVDGYKFIEGKPGFRKDTGYAIDDPIYDKMYEFIQSTGLPVLHHIADPAKCWDITKATPIMIQRGWVYDETYRTLPQLREETEGLLRKFPNIKVTLAHFYFTSDDYEGAVRLMETYPNVCVDLTPGGEMFKNFSADIDKWRSFFVKYQGRILYGTDTYNIDYGNNPDDYEDSGDAGHRNNFVRFVLEKSEPFEDIHVGNVIPLNLPEEVRKNIYHDNYIRIAGETPRQVNKSVCAQKAAMLAEIFEHGLVPIRTHGTPELEIENMKTCYRYFSE